MDFFTYHSDILADFPSIQAGVIHADGLENRTSPDDLTSRYRSEQESVRQRLADTPLADLPSISAWRRAFSRFGAKPTQYRNASEALLRRLTKQGDIPSISTLVDLGNLVSIRHAVPVAVIDLDGISGRITVRYAKGSEPFDDLGSSETAHPEPGEVVFTDDAGRVHARRWCWRQSAQSATGPDTTRCLFVIEALHDNAAEAVDRATDDLMDLLSLYQPDADLTRWRLP